MVVKTFRGLLADGGQDRIRLQTIKGKVGYRIVKFQLMPGIPGGANQDSVIQIWKTEQSSVVATANFTDSDLLACGIYSQHSTQYNMNAKIVFDSEIFNQDIYVTHKDEAVGQTCNYYLELEVIPLDDAGAEYTTLKDMRST